MARRAHKDQDMKLEIDISDDTIRNLVGSASIAWSEPNLGVWDEDSLTLTLYAADECPDDEGEDEDGELLVGPAYTADRAAFQRALALLAAGPYKHHFADIITGNTDMWTGHIFVQLALFGEERYS